MSLARREFLMFLGAVGMQSGLPSQAGLSLAPMMSTTSTNPFTYTTLDENAIVNSPTLELTNGAFSIGDELLVQLDDGSIHACAVTAVDTVDVEITIDPVLPSAAAAGNWVQVANPEVVEARNGFSTLNDRLDSMEGAASKLSAAVSAGSTSISAYTIPAWANAVIIEPNDANCEVRPITPNGNTATVAALANQHPKDAIVRFVDYVAYSPHWYGDGTDDTASFEAMIADILDTTTGAVIQLNQGAKYYLDALTIDKKVIIKGNGATIDVDSAMTNNVDIRLEASGIRWENTHIELNDDGTNNSAPIGLLVTGNNVLLDRLTIYNGHKAVEFREVMGGVMRDCELEHKTIKSGVGFNNHFQGVRLAACINVHIQRVKVTGYGEPIILTSFNQQPTQDSSVTYCSVFNADDNGMYLNNAENCIVSHNLIRGFDQNGIEAHGQNEISFNKIEALKADVSGINIQAHGTPDPNDGFTHESVLVQGNKIVGDLSYGITIRSHPTDKGNIKSPKILYNEIEFRDTNQIHYAIQFHAEPGRPGRSVKAQVVGNVATGHKRGLAMQVENSNDIHKDALIQGNNFDNAENFGFILFNLQDSMISNNSAKNTDFGGTSSDAGLKLKDSTSNKIMDNYFGDTRGTTYQSYGVLEDGTCQNNYVGNILEGANTPADLDASSTIKPNATKSLSFGATASFKLGEADVYILTNTHLSSALPFNPSGDFTAGYRIMVHSTTASQSDIKFDNNGIMSVLKSGQSAEYIYTGSVWQELFKV